DRREAGIAMGARGRPRAGASAADAAGTEPVACQPAEDDGTVAPRRASRARPRTQHLGRRARTTVAVAAAARERGHRPRGARDAHHRVRVIRLRPTAEPDLAAV